MRPTRREFLGGIAAGALAGALRVPGRVNRRANRRVTSELDELVRWIIEVPRAHATAEAIDRLKRGLPPEPFYAALFLAGVSDIEPRPLGFKFHCVMQMSSVWNVASRLAPAERALPLVYALDFFKQSQERQLQSGAWHLPPPDDHALPAAAQAVGELDAAMEAWDVAKADAAVTALARSAKPERIVAALAPWSLRSFGDAGHAPIYAANGFRTLDVIGWSHAEPVLRSLVQGLLALDRTRLTAPFESARELAKSGGESSPKSPPPPMNWTGAYERALELLARSPGLFAVHATTGVEAIHHLARRVADDSFERLAGQVATGWLPLWRVAFERGGSPRAVDFAQLLQASPADAAAPARDPLAALDELGDDRWRTARAIVGGLRDEKTRTAFLARARALLVAKGHEAHDWKFFVALEEAVARVGAGHDPADDSARMAALLAAGVHYLRDGADADFGPVAEARAALAQ